MTDKADSLATAITRCFGSIQENQLGRRNLSDDQRAVIALSVVERRSEMAKNEQRRKAIAARWDRGYGSDTSTDPYKPDPTTTAASNAWTATFIG